MNNNLEIINNIDIKKCLICNGQGCQKCSDTGNIINKNYIMIYITKNSQKIAFSTDTIK